MTTPHTSCQRGKTVVIKLRNGVVVYGKFIERTGKFIILDCGKFRGVDVKSFSIIKHKETK